MAQTTKTVKVNTKIDVAALVQAKMAEKMMDAVGDGKDIPLTKLTIMQSLANGGGIDVNELIRAKRPFFRGSTRIVTAVSTLRNRAAKGGCSTRAAGSMNRMQLKIRDAV